MKMFADKKIKKISLTFLFLWDWIFFFFLGGGGGGGGELHEIKNWILNAN